MTETDNLISAEQFAEQRHEFPDGGRWAELEAGKVVTLSDTDVDHGTAILNLSKALAGAVRPTDGYACFDQRFILARNPDTVRSASVAFFKEGPAFAEMDKPASETRPALLVEIASTKDRRLAMRDRVEAWLKWGVPHVWVLDTHAKTVHLFAKHQSPRQLTGTQILTGGEIVPQLSVATNELFDVPKWYR